MLARQLLRVTPRAIKSPGQLITRIPAKHALRSTPSRRSFNDSHPNRPITAEDLRNLDRISTLFGTINLLVIVVMPSMILGMGLYSVYRPSGYGQDIHLRAENTSLKTVNDHLKDKVETLERCLGNK